MSRCAWVSLAGVRRLQEHLAQTQLSQNHVASSLANALVNKSKPIQQLVVYSFSRRIVLRHPRVERYKVHQGILILIILQASMFGDLRPRL